MQENPSMNNISNFERSSQLDRIQNQQSQIVSYKWVRKQQPLVFFLLCLISHLYTSFEALAIVQIGVKIKQTPQEYTRIFLITFAVRIFIMFVNSLYICEIKGIFYSYTMLDVLGVLAISNSGMIIALFLSFYIPLNLYNSSTSISAYALNFLLYVSLAGNFRLMIKTAKWHCFRVISYKIVLYISCFFCIGYGIYFSMVDLDLSNVCTPCVPGNPFCQSSCKTTEDCCFDMQNEMMKSFKGMGDYIIIITGTGLALNSEMISFMGNYDGTSQSNTHYTIGLQQQNQQNNVLRQKIQKQNPNLQRQLKQVQQNVIKVKQTKFDFIFEEQEQKSEIQEIQKRNQ